MPITLAPLGNLVVASEVENNFLAMQDLHRSGLVNLDTVGALHRWKFVRYDAGKLAEVSLWNQPRVEDGKMGVSKYLFDFTYRHAREDANPAVIDFNGFMGAGPYNHYAMELLGRPGPSFYGEWQEQGNAEPTGAVNWPPSWWPISRYPQNLCYSRWLTVPHCSWRGYVPHPCTIRIRATFVGSLNMFRCNTFVPIRGSAVGNEYLNMRDMHFGRFGLIVDTNPVLYADEFPNTNPNITVPITGGTAPYVTWKVVEDQTINLPQRAVVHLEGEVAVKGGRYYSIRFAFRDALHHGWVEDTGGAGTFHDESWELSPQTFPLAPNIPVFNPAWLALMSGTYGITNYESHCFGPSWLNLWEGNHLALEFDYGRSTSHITDSSAAEFVVKTV